MGPQLNLVRKHFANSNEYARWFLDKEREKVSSRYFWDLPASAEGAERLLSGNRNYNDEIEAIKEQIWENIPRLQRVWRIEMVGAFPSVPAYLAGVPDTMYSLQSETSEHTPIKIWVGVTSSAAIDRAQLVKRGAVLAAFAQALSQVRPVCITPYVNLGNDGGWGERYEGSLISWDIQSSPMVMSDVAASLIDPDVVRHLGINACIYLNNKTTTKWLRGFNDEAAMREMLGAQEEDIYLGSIHLYDPLLSDPIKWVKEHLEKYTSELEV